MSIVEINPLLIGELQACAIKNDFGVTYIAIGPITDDDDSAIGIDEIEARALHEWLGRALKTRKRRTRAEVIKDLRALVVRQPHNGGAGK